jgi:hypothetical protein
MMEDNALSLWIMFGFLLIFSAGYNLRFESNAYKKNKSKMFKRTIFYLKDENITLKRPNSYLTFSEIKTKFSDFSTNGITQNIFYGIVFFVFISILFSFIQVKFTDNISSTVTLLMDEFVKYGMIFVYGSIAYFFYNTCKFAFSQFLQALNKDLRVEGMNGEIILNKENKTVHYKGDTYTLDDIVECEIKSWTYRQTSGGSNSTLSMEHKDFYLHLLDNTILDIYNGTSTDEHKELTAFFEGHVKISGLTNSSKVARLIIIIFLLIPIFISIKSFLII